MSAAACFMIDGECLNPFRTLCQSLCSPPSSQQLAPPSPRCLLSASVELTRDFCEQLDGLVGPQLTLLASDICEQFTINRRISGSVAKPSLCKLVATRANSVGYEEPFTRRLVSVFINLFPSYFLSLLGIFNLSTLQMRETLLSSKY